MTFGKYLIFFGVLLVVIGIVVAVVEKIGIKKMPLDISFQKGNVSVFFPLGTSLLVSLILTVILNLFSRK